MPENSRGTVPDEVCRHCLMPLNRRSRMGAPEAAAEWLHPRPPEDGHAPDPIPRAEAPYIVMICDFCSGDGARWSYPTETEVTNILAVADTTGREVRRQFAKYWETVKPELGEVEHLAANVFSDRWAACDPCSTLIEARDLERLVTRVRRADEQRRGKAQGPRQAYREHFAGFWQQVREREPLDGVR